MSQHSAIDTSAIDGFIAKALAVGATRDIKASRSGVMLDAQMCGDCADPIEMYRAGFSTGPSGQAKLDAVSGSAGRQRRAYSVRLRCRKCYKCLQARARYWRKAAMHEMMYATTKGGRTWFGTLTLTPQHHAEADYAAYGRLGGQKEFWALSPERQFAERHASVNRRLTLALKRLRKSMGPDSFRYLLVCEAHKSGLPHYHMLLHECSAIRPLRKSALNDFWDGGFSQWRLAKPAAAGYVAKYLSKAALARVRASRHYGSPVHTTSSDSVLRNRVNHAPQGKRESA